jgi:hypothetical protein
MADERVHTGGPEAPPAGEPIHLPGPTYLPVTTAAGITTAVIGVVIWWVLVVIGVLVTIVAIWRWIQDTRRDMAELPLEHHS